ncbi:hypothetical protein NHF40_09180 [Maricaulaceae bacterium EIL42A08]|nr:hypothetical protein [Maricaulaceae bacterium EIL42A08]
MNGRQVIDLTSLSASEGFIIQGDEAQDAAGVSVSSAGDVNGDGYDDLIVGAYLGDDDGSNAGEAYVVFGSAAGFGVDVSGRQVIDLTSLSAAEGFIIQGDAAGDEAGWSVSSAGDVNGDGYDDLIVGAYRGDDGGSGAGEAYVVFGSAIGFGVDVSGRQVIDLTSLSASEGFIIQGDAALDFSGVSVSSAGDVNGDGYDDLIVGADLGDDGGTNAGEAYVVFGSATGSTDGITASGTSGVNTIVGGAGNDTLDGEGGADVIRAGAGDDVLAVDDASFFRLDGGRGMDTLRVDGSGIDLDFTTLSQNAVTDIEIIDLTGSGGNTLTLTALDVLDMMEARESGSAVLRVRGDGDDTVDLSDTGWASAGQITEGSVTYNRYTKDNVELRVEDGVSVVSGGMRVASFGEPVVVSFSSINSGAISEPANNDAAQGMHGEPMIVDMTGGHGGFVSPEPLGDLVGQMNLDHTGSTSEDWAIDLTDQSVLSGRLELYEDRELPSWLQQSDALQSHLEAPSEADSSSVEGAGSDGAAQSGGFGDPTVVDLRDASLPIGEAEYLNSDIGGRDVLGKVRPTHEWAIDLTDQSEAEGGAALDAQAGLHADLITEFEALRPLATFAEEPAALLGQTIPFEQLVRRGEDGLLELLPLEDAVDAEGWM